MGKTINRNFLLNLILISLAISPALTLEDNRNLLLIGVMSFSPIIILISSKIDVADKSLWFFLASILVFPNLFHPETMRWSTVLYSIMFALTFIAFKQLLQQNNLSITHYSNILKYLIYAYCIVLLIQQFCVLMGLPIFNLSNYDPNEPWKLNSLSAEPSHSGRIVALLMYSYITIDELVTNRKYGPKFILKKDKWVWIAFFWTMITIGSGTAIFFLIIVLFKFLRVKKLITFVIFSIVFISILNSIEIKSIERSKNVFLSTLTLDKSTILKVDHSAAMRIVPVIVTANHLELNSVNGWFGNGVDFTSEFMSDEVPGLPKGKSGGGLFQIWLEYGFISFTFFVVFSFSSVYRKRDYLSFIFWFFIVLIYGVNNQIVWLCIILLFTNKYFHKKQNFIN